MGSLESARPYALTAFRIALGLVIFSFGAAKILHIYPGNFTPPIGSLPWTAGLIELIAGFLSSSASRPEQRPSSCPA